ncbi:MAG: Holliday junction branch migration protein RuvA [Nitrospirae bacterium]|nr:Holliday junction branch migration protein RuvA [Nitrospirota bacterium]
MTLIASLKGKVLSKKPDGVVVDVGGVGYHVHIPLSSLSNIPDVGAEILFHTYTHVREDALQLYGFLTEEEKRVFITLLNINGIGPKLGLAILSGMPAKKFVEAVYNEDIALLTTIPGLGKKIASRLVLELREKLPSATSAYSGDNILSDDAVSALVNLGYKRSVSENAVEKALKSGANAIEDIIKEALKYLTESK